MFNKLSFPRQYWKGLVFVLLAYTVVQLISYQSFFRLPAIIQENRQLMRWMAIAVVYLVGCFVLKGTGVAWLLGIWHVIHLSLVGYLFLIGIYEYTVAPVPYGIRASVAPVVEFLISPLLYFAAGLVFAVVRE
jgi:uncharacterized membrane protein YwzB